MTDELTKITNRIGDQLLGSGTLTKLHEIEDATTIYNIHYCRAGVGFSFYEPPDDFEIKFPYKSEEWRQYLHVYAYYPTFEEAVEGEYKRLGLAD